MYLPLALAVVPAAKILSSDLLQLGYKFPGSEGDRSYSQHDTPLLRYHVAAAGSVSRSSLAVTVDALTSAAPPTPAAATSGAAAVEVIEGEADVWSLIRATWPVQRALYQPKPSNGDVPPCCELLKYM